MNSAVKSVDELLEKRNVGGTHASKMKGRNIIQKNVSAVSWTSVTFSNYTSKDKTEKKSIALYMHLRKKKYCKIEKSVLRVEFFYLYICKYFNQDILLKEMGDDGLNKKPQTDRTYLQKIFYNSCLLFCWVFTAFYSQTQLLLHICQKVALGIKTKSNTTMALTLEVYDMLTKKNKRKSLVHALITQCQSTPFKCKQLSIFQCD